MRRLALIPAIFILLQMGGLPVLSAEAYAQDVQTAPADSPTHPPPLFVTVFFTNPQIISVSLLSGFTLDGTDVEDAEGVFFEVEPGLGGGRVTVGRRLSSVNGIHFDWKGAVLRTWGDPWGLHPNQTFVGAETVFGGKYSSFRLGLFGDVSGGPDSWLISAGIGFSFH